MNRSNQKCPYCGKRMTYFSAYFCRRKAEYVCPRCGKESKVTISKLIIPIFIIAAVIALLVMGIWFFFQLLSNPWGIVLVALPLVLFFAFSPMFVRLEPLRKYQKSMEARKAGIEYSDNLTALDFEDDGSSLDGNKQFKVNSDLFNQIKSSRSAPKEQLTGKEIVSDSGSVPRPVEEPSVPVIQNVRADHAGTGSEPLKKVHAEGSKVKRPQSAAEEAPNVENAEQPPAQDVSALKRLIRSKKGTKEKDKEKKTEQNRYSGNRRF